MDENRAAGITDKNRSVKISVGYFRQNCSKTPVFKLKMLRKLRFLLKKWKIFDIFVEIKVRKTEKVDKLIGFFYRIYSCFSHRLQFRSAIFLLVTVFTGYLNMRFRLFLLYLLIRSNIKNYMKFAYFFIFLNKNFKFNETNL